jgi:hypothetical protein
MSSLLNVSGTQNDAYRGGRNGVRIKVMVKSGLRKKIDLGKLMKDFYVVGEYNLLSICGEARG